MTQRGDHMLLQWWREPIDYSWVIDFLRPRGLLAGLRAIIGAGGLAMAVALGCLLCGSLRRPVALSEAAIVAMIAMAVAWAVFWWRFPWPSARVSAALFFAADVGIAVATGVNARPLAALSTTPLFAMTGLYIVFFHGPRAYAVHVLVAGSTIAGAATWLATSGQVDAVPLAISKAVIAAVTLGVLPFVQLGFWLVRRNAVESSIDPLTGLANRRGLVEYLTADAARVSSSSDPAGVLVVDLDDFKRVNDTYGHQVGDAVIVRAAARIRSSVSRTAVVARIGGEEFVVVDRAAVDHMAMTGERIRTAIRSDGAPNVTASVGLAVGVITTHEAFEEICGRADDAMYAAKRAGGDALTIDRSVRGQRTDVGWRPMRNAG